MTSPTQKRFLDGLCIFNGNDIPKKSLGIISRHCKTESLFSLVSAFVLGPCTFVSWFCQLTNESFLKADMRSALVWRGCSMNKFRQPFPSSTYCISWCCTLYLSHSDYLSNYNGTTLVFNRPMGQSNSGRSWTSIGSKSPRRGQGNPFLCRDLLLV